MGVSKKAGQAPKRRPPAKTPEGRENQLISLAIDLAEKQLMEGTASSQVISHYLKLGSTEAKLNQQILTHQRDLIKAKTEQIKDSKKSEELYANAIKAMRSYSGRGSDDDD